jgi:hypothetical protein
VIENFRFFPPELSSKPALHSNLKVLVMKNPNISRPKKAREIEKMKGLVYLPIFWKDRSDGFQGWKHPLDGHRKRLPHGVLTALFGPVERLVSLF